MLKVAKFGGTSLADAEQIKKAVNIIRADSTRRFVILSAPGKRNSKDEKITDILYSCADEAATCGTCEKAFGIVRERFLGIAKDLGVPSDTISRELDIVQQTISKGCSRDYIASRGEYLNSLVISAYLGMEFIDAAEIIRFDQNGNFLSEETNKLCADRLSGMPSAVIPGFYGALPDGQIKTFSRGGSDITGSIIARAVDATLYENWTDVSGFLVADPRIVENPAVIETITYKELRELSYMGAGVLHEDAVFPVQMSGIPINIRNTNKPEDKGTMIVSKSDEPSRANVTGIAGKKGFTIITVEKDRMNSELGFGRRVLSILEQNGISFEHMPTGIDVMSVVISDANINGKLEKVISELEREVEPDSLEVTNNLALIATVGRGMNHNVGTAGKLFWAIGEAKINIRMIDQGSSELNIIVGVDNSDFNRTLQVLYHAFFGEE